MKRAQKKLSDEDVAKILSEAKKESFFDYVAIKTLTVLDLRRAELVGQNDHRSHDNPGMLIEKLTDKGIWLRRKKHEEDTFVPIPHDLRVEIDEIVGGKKLGPIFPRTTGWVWYRVQHYAIKGGIQDAKLIHPHSLRHWATTRIGKKFGVIRARDSAGHANISTTNRYISQSDDSELMEASQKLLESVEIG